MTTANSNTSTNCKFEKYVVRFPLPPLDKPIMARERKYTKMGENPVRYECTKKKCKWQGKMEDKYDKRVSSYETVKVCPNCGNDEFYGLLN